jgi:hypothetical protein
MRRKRRAPPAACKSKKGTEKEPMQLSALAPFP